MMTIVIILWLLWVGIATPTMPYPVKMTFVHQFCHAIEIYQQAEKNLVGGGAISVDAS